MCLEFPQPLQYNIFRSIIHRYGLVIMFFLWMFLFYLLGFVIYRIFHRHRYERKRWKTRVSWKLYQMHEEGQGGKCKFEVQQVSKSDASKSRKIELIKVASKCVVCCIVSWSSCIWIFNCIEIVFYLKPLRRPPAWYKSMGPLLKMHQNIYY